jgi:hypothetical protein
MSHVREIIHSLVQARLEQSQPPRSGQQLQDLSKNFPGNDKDFYLGLSPAEQVSLRNYRNSMSGYSNTYMRPSGTTLPR